MSILDPITDSLILSIEKGMPPGDGMRVNDIASQGWNVLSEDMTFPIAVIQHEALLSNARWMDRFAQDQGVLLYPHGKTTMAPQLFQLQLQNGCSGITAANVIHAQVYLEHGVTSVFIANQVLGKQSIDRMRLLCADYPDAEFFVIVDSQANVEELAAGLKGCIESRQIRLLLEMGAPGGRTGVRSVDEAVALARFMSDLGVACSGIEAFEGIFNINDVAAAEHSVRQLLAGICDAYTQIAEQGFFSPGNRYLSAGGSWYYDLVADYFKRCDSSSAVEVIIRAGCTISHDSGLCKRAYANMLERGVIAPGDHLQPALEVWAQVQSQPEQGRAYANAGKRDLSHDIDLPVVRWWYRPGLHHQPQPLPGSVEVTALNDQHTYLSYDDTVSLAVGDLIGFGVSHPCTTFDKWKFLYTVDDDYTVSGAIKTFF